MTCVFFRYKLTIMVFVKGTFMSLALRECVSEDSLTSQLFVPREKRASKRVPARWPVKVTMSNGSKMETMTDNISETGLLFFSKKHIEAGSKAHLRISTYTGGVPFVMDAIVVVRHISIANNQFKCGAEFVFMGDESKKFVRHFVSNRNPHGQKSKTILG